VGIGKEGVSGRRHGLSGVLRRDLGDMGSMIKSGRIIVIIVVVVHGIKAGLEVVVLVVGVAAGILVDGDREDGTRRGHGEVSVDPSLVF